LPFNRTSSFTQNGSFTVDKSPAVSQAGFSMTYPQDVMDMFFSQVSEIQAAIRLLGENVTRIETLHSRSLNTVPDTPEYHRITKDLDRVKADVRSSSAYLRTQIKQLEYTNGQAPSPQDANVKRTQTAAAKDRFIEVIQRYSSVEAAHRQASKQRLAKQYRIIKPDATEEEISYCLEDPFAAETMFAKATLSTKRSGEATAVLNNVQARQADLERIEATIVELAQLFQDMSMMVEEQHVAICAIEEKAHSAEKDMEAAHIELVKAKVSALSARSKRRICFSIGLVVVLVFAAIIAWLVVSRNKSHNNTATANQSNLATAIVTRIVTATQMASQTVSSAPRASATAAGVRASTAISS